MFDLNFYYQISDCINFLEDDNKLRRMILEMPLCSDKRALGREYHYNLHCKGNIYLANGIFKYILELLDYFEEDIYIN